MPCRSKSCGCGIVSNSLDISGDGDPWQIESNGVTMGTMAERVAVIPFAGQVWYETDTGRTWLYTGSAWKIQHDPIDYEVVNFTPAATTDATVGAPFALWLTLPSVTAPPWAGRLVAHFEMTGHYHMAAATYAVQPRLGGVAPGNDGRFWTATHTEFGRRNSDSSIASWSGIVGGTTYPLSVYAALAGGTGPLRADTLTYVKMLIHWKEA